MRDAAQDAVQTIDAYIAAQPEALRALIRAEAPEASERIAYGLATFWLNGNLVHFGGFKAHIGLYPGATGVAAFESELGPYVHSKGAIQFPLDQPLPMELIRRIVAMRVEQNRAARKTRRSAAQGA